MVFGKIMDEESLLVVRKIENVPTAKPGDQPKMAVVIDQCGEL